MKVIKKVLFSLLLTIIGITNIKAASNKLYELGINIFINNDGSAHITEIWDMYVGEGTEVYKPMTNLDDIKLTNFQVKDETGTTYKEVSWNVNGSLSDKKNKNGINYTSSGFELCWGMGSHGAHTYTVSYDVTNFVSDVEDGQIIYWKLVNDSMNPSPQKVKVVISSNKFFEDTVAVWGYGYKGYAYVKDGKIYLESENGISKEEYMVLLTQLDTNTFETDNIKEGAFEDWHNKAEEGTYSYNYEDESESIIEVVMVILFTFIPIFFTIIIIIVAASQTTPNLEGNYDFGKNYKKPKLKDIQYFRELPCNKNIYRGYFVASLFGATKKKEDFLGSIFLKWLSQGQIQVIETPASFLSKNKTSIDLKNITSFENPLEEKLYGWLKVASKDNILESKEFEKWCSANYSKILTWFQDVLKEERKKLVQEGLLIEEETTSLKIFKSKKYVVTDRLKEEGMMVLGLKKFLIEFSEMKTKEAIEVNLWQEYLMFAQIFGIANKVAKQFKNLYPEVVTNMNYEGVIMVNNFAYTGVVHAQSARSAAQSYSSGGGGFSSGGGGGFSSGGGSGGGCR